MYDTCQSNKLIYFLEWNWYNKKGWTKNKIFDGFQGHIFYINYLSNITVARHFASYQNIVDPRMTIYIQSTSNTEVCA